MLTRLISALLSLVFLGLIFLICAYIYLQSGLPNVEALKEVHLQVPLNIYSSDHKLIAEYGEKRRIPSTLQEVPPLLIKGILATEDQRFYEHPGVDIVGLARAAVQIIRTGAKVEGGSTITMQVARNFFLDSKKTYLRKINEILLAVKIDHELSKEKILELYLNKIYLGNRAYGVAAAAQVYYGKTLDQLTLGEMAMIAGLPKAPSTLNPLANPRAAKKRRDHVLARMVEQGYITQAQCDKAVSEPIHAIYHGPKIEVQAPYVAEMIRQTLYDKFGEDAYSSGMQVVTTIDSRLQALGNAAVKNTVLQYDAKRGYSAQRVAVRNMDSLSLEHLRDRLTEFPSFGAMIPGIILSINEDRAHVLTKQSGTVLVDRRGFDLDETIDEGNSPNALFRKGDVIYLENVNEHWRLRQIPKAEGALIALNPQNGAVLSLVGGFDFNKSKFNRITQAQRQPGSSFKPFIYAAALDKGYTLASIINDAPIVIEDPSQETLWRPQNDTKKFYGPTRLRVGLTHSRNLVSIRLLDEMGMRYTLNYLERFGFDKQQLPANLSLALGTLDISPLKLAQAYAIFANGGFQIDPYVISRITRADGTLIYAAKNKIACAECEADGAELDVPKAQRAPRVLSAQTAYLITSVLKDVILQGTAQAAKVLNRPDLAGKTGTTNEQRDNWFAGFNYHLVVITWMGYDQPQSLHEYASNTALPMWIRFMRDALNHQPLAAMPEPAGLVSLPIDAQTGAAASPDQPNTITEIFTQDHLPRNYTGPAIEAGDQDKASPTEQDTSSQPAVSAPVVEELF